MNENRTTQNKLKNEKKIQQQQQRKKNSSLAGLTDILFYFLLYIVE